MRFIAIFSVLLGVYLAFSVTAPFGRLMDPYLRLNALVSAWMLGPIEPGVNSREMLVSSPRFAVRIQRGCDAVDPSAIFAAAVLAFPVAMRRRLAGVVAGVLALCALNLIRIVTLFFAGVHFPDLFDVLHHEIWQAAFIFLALAMWVAWAAWATRPGSAPRHAPG